MAKLSELLDSLDFVSSGEHGENIAYLCRNTGRIYWHSDSIDDEEELPDNVADESLYLRVPHKHDLNLDKPLALRFVAETDPELLPAARAVFEQPDAYTRFDNLLEDKAMLEQWHSYEEQARIKAIKKWCADNGIEVEE